ncbi:MAG: ribosome assembly factor SBDS [Candidatus Aenigmarchaeota archaeon]|nr:ribosome assembly factor SBDS [Candidatus Aenigmarchaeota archaeon]
MSVSIEKAVISRLTVSGQKFEILVDPSKATDWKSGKAVAIEDVLAYPVIYKDVKASESAADSELQRAFGTTNPNAIAGEILKKGEIQITTEQRREMVEQKRAQIASLISRRGINPQTNTPHPEQRILNAMQQGGINIDPFMDTEAQLDRVVESIKRFIPIKFQNVVVQVKIPPQFAGKSFSMIKASGKLMGEQWLGDGSLQAEIQILAGALDEFIQKMSNLTHGNFESKVIKREDA